jgi:tRNA pseudouridine55 synthase
MNGWILLDKPYGLSSTSASTLVRKITGSQKAGHAGTLDPLATGVLPIALDEATKTIPYVVEDTKQYRFQVTWGEQRTTDDAQGTIIATSEHRPSSEAIMAALPQFQGIIDQMPPPFSALKVNGERAYTLARAGKIPDLKSRPVRIDAFTLESIDQDNQATFVVTCGPGTYVRSLARDLAIVLGTVGYVSSLRRVFVGKFHEKDAISLEKLREFRHKEAWNRVLLPLEAVLDDIPAVPVSEEEAIKIYQGQRIFVPKIQNEFPLVVLKKAGRGIAIAECRDGYFYPKRVFNYIER